MPKRMLRNVLLMAVITVLMAIALVFYIRNTQTLPGGENPGSVLLHDGVYTSVQQGYISEVTVTVTVSGGKVSAVEADASGETPSLGGVAAADLAASLTEAGSTANVDVVAGSTYTSQAVLDGMDDCLAQAAEG
ncbi:MAG TPA: FMN-binding protein [Candidatus Faecalibacterium faecigallinarum]|uniref:FMN-binding protein n=1 Tax=Candidatus Faecalibacterium faecigallinarum TaxID=2838577 RepID=A0A9D2T572_9FIRM|nr:FMN-binding protein [Candidatus Faecalibacterium faecigallinarum]